MNLPSTLSERTLDTADNEVNLSDLLDTLLQHIWLISIVFVAAIVIGGTYALLATPIYQADALIQVEDKKPTTLSGVQDIANALGAGSSPVSGEIEILRSREVVMKAVAATRADVKITPQRFPVIGAWFARRYKGVGKAAPAPLGLSQYAWGGEVLRLDELKLPESFYDKKLVFRSTEQGYNIEDEEGEVLSTGVVGQLLTFLLQGEPVRVFVGDLIANPGAAFEVVRVNPVSSYRNISSVLSVAEVGKQSSVIRIGYQHESVDFAQKLINAIASAYLTQNVERRSAEADQSLKFLDAQLPKIKQSVDLSEDRLNSFRTRTNTVSVEKSTDSLLGRAVSVQKNRLELELKRDELMQNFKPDHPVLKAIDAQLAATNRESNNVSEMVNKLPVAQRDLLRLQRDAEVNNELYIALLNNAQQLKVAKAGTVGNVRVIDFAIRDFSPVAPKKTIIVAIAGILGLLLGAAAALVVRLLRPTIRNVEEIERAIGLVSYANVPESIAQEKLDSSKRDKKGREAIIEGRSQVLAMVQPDDPAIESLRSLRTGLAFALMGATDKNIVITGATAGLGKSFISANLSVLLASTGKRVLLVETDMRRPQLGTYFGYGKVAGLSELLAGAVTFDNVVRKDVSSGGGQLDVLPSGQIPPNPGELLLNEAFARLMSDLQPVYDHILLDSAPVLPVGDTLAVARCASTIFMVVRAELSTVAEVRDAVRKLGNAGVSVKGVIFNGVKRRRVGYGYAYKYHYGYDSK